MNSLKISTATALQPPLSLCSTQLFNIFLEFCPSNFGFTKCDTVWLRSAVMICLQSSVRGAIFFCIADWAHEFDKSNSPKRSSLNMFNYRTNWTTIDWLGLISRVWFSSVDYTGIMIYWERKHLYRGLTSKIGDRIDRIRDRDLIYLKLNFIQFTMLPTFASCSMIIVSGRKNVLHKLLRIPYRRLKAGFSLCWLCLFVAGVMSEMHEVQTFAPCKAFLFDMFAFYSSHENYFGFRTTNVKGKTDHSVSLRWNKRFWTFLKRRVFFWLCIWLIYELISPGSIKTHLYSVISSYG